MIILLGPYTQQEGFFEYYEIMQAFNNDTLPWLPGKDIF